MVLYIGGRSQNKQQCAVMNQDITNDMIGISGEEALYEDIFTASYIYDFHKYVFRYHKLLSDGKQQMEFVKKLTECNPNIVIIADEIGCGIVPLEQSIRAYQNEYGRLMCSLADKSCKVIRVICGIGQIIKE